MTTITHHATRLWLKAHRAHESRLSRLLRSFFASRRREVMDRVIAGELSDATLLDVDDWTTGIINLCGPELVRYAFSAAAQELGGGVASLQIELPLGVQVGVRLALNEAMAQPYWAAIGVHAQQQLAAGLQAAINSGGGLEAMVAAVHDAIGSDVSRRRAETIATTETTNALNCGRHEARGDLARSGHITTLEYIAIIGDDRTRPDHAALDSTTQPASNPQWNFGGHIAPYPGHPSLPPEQRIRCRCSTIVRD